MIFLVKSFKMQNLQVPNIEKVLLMIKALNRKTLWLWGSNFLLFHDLRTILFQTFKYSINNKFNFSRCRVQIWPPAPSLVNYMRLFVDESNKETHAIVSLGDAPRPFWTITLLKWVQSCYKGYIWTTIVGTYALQSPAWAIKQFLKFAVAVAVVAVACLAQTPDI
jgi:hypothetical protein